MAGVVAVTTGPAMIFSVRPLVATTPELSVKDTVIPPDPATDVVPDSTPALDKVIPDGSAPVSVQV